MSITSHVSLLDLSQQFPFEIDDKLKKEICFGESLIISCGHYEGDYDDDWSDSWTCQSSTATEKPEEVKDNVPKEFKEVVPSDSQQEEEEDEYGDNFYFYFFPDCKKPPPTAHSKTSILIGKDGLPKINLAATEIEICECKKDKKGRCKCFTCMPCLCGAKTAVECTCSKLEKVCICQPGAPQTVCKCKSAKPCICDPHGKVLPECICKDVEKPCICPPFKSPYPICICKNKPKSVFSTDDSVSSSRYEDNEGGFYDYVREESVREPCECQAPEPKKQCHCKRGKDCICRIMCVCGIQRSCVCESTESVNMPCKNEVHSICSCEMQPKPCVCEKVLPDECICFPRRECTCGDPDNCKCFKICECKDPCLCDTAPTKKELVCTCKPGSKLSRITCTCPKRKDNKLRRVRASRQGYRWCNEVDPNHTYFDFAYNRHHLIEKKESVEAKVSIQGLHDPPPEIECEVHGTVKAPLYERKIRKPSLDCCSAVGGISINIESLGEDKDKFLVQVVSYSSREGAKTGSKLVSILDCNLHTMEENRIEHVTKRNLTKEKRNYMAICASGYYNKVTTICGDRDVVKRFYHTFEKAHDFLLEGANLVLLRYLGLSRYRGNIKTATVLMDGVICESVYVCLGVSQAVVNGTPLFVVKVERHIIEPSGYIHQSLTVLTLRGYLVSHEWADNCYVLHLNPLLNVVPEKDEIESHAPLRSKWREDLQLLSDYLDFKSARTSEGGRYLTESGGLTGAVRDFLQAILLLRPQDTLNFTRHYFSSVLSALDLPHDEYFDPLSKHVRYYFYED